MIACYSSRGGGQWSVQLPQRTAHPPSALSWSVSAICSGPPCIYLSSTALHHRRGLPSLSTASMRWFTLPRLSSDTTEPEEPRPTVLKRPSLDVSTPSEALRHFERPGVPIPPSSRVGDPKLKQRESQPVRLWHLWKYGAFAAVKGVLSLPSQVFCIQWTHSERAAVSRFLPFDAPRNTLRQGLRGNAGKRSAMV